MTVLFDDRVPPTTLVGSSRVRVWELSATGCLLESREPLPVGMVGALELALEGEPRTEWFRICRVHVSEARRGSCLVAAEFLPLRPAAAASLRAAIRRLTVVELGEMASASGRSSGDTGNFECASQVARRDSSKTPRHSAENADVAELATPLLKSQSSQRAHVRGSQKGVAEMMNLIARFVREDEGQDLIEYVLIGTFVSIGALIGATALGTQLNGWYTAMSTWVSTQAGKV